MIPAARQQAVEVIDNQQVLLIVNAGNTAAADLAEQWSVSRATLCSAGELDPSTSGSTDMMVIMLRQPWCPVDDPDLQATLRFVQQVRPLHVCVVTGCAAHFAKRDPVGHPPAGLDELEARLLQEVPDDVRLTIVRTGLLLSPQAETLRWLERWSWLKPLLGKSLCSTFVTMDELDQLLADVLFDELPDDAESRFRGITLLGSRRPWRDVLEESGQTGCDALMNRTLSVLARVSAFCGAGQLLHGLFRLNCRRRLEHRVLAFDAIVPESEAELLSLCHRQNIGQVAVCGYNNGVNHFGWDYGRRTAVPTLRSGRTLRIDAESVTVDAGITLRQCVDALDQADRELLVVPNYSYICLGTVFFVPVHGSGSEVSTLGDSIEWIRYYDPEVDRVSEASRQDPVFRQLMYDLSGNCVVLQLRLKTRPKSDYYVEQETSHDPSAEDVWSLFEDRGPSNIEVRKHRASDQAIHVSRYYTSGDGGSQRLEVPRDTIGSLWDRLEENRVTAFLFHWLVRHLAFHVELFLREAEFHAFWEHHSALPLSKIQLRAVRRDGMPHSPFCDEDCVSADLFMHKRHRRAFQQFVREYLPDVRHNPGKQSMRGRDE